MARVDIPILDVAKNLAAGVDLVDGSVSADDSDHHRVLARSSRVVILCWTASMSGVDLEFVSVEDPYGRLGGEAEEGPETVGASEFRAFGPFSPGLFSQKAGADQNYMQVNVTNLSGTVQLVAVSVP